MEPIASTTHGKVRGFTDETASVFLGIPFAAPPVGEHRFLAPAPPESWDGVRDALAYGPTAPQRDPGITIIPEPVERGDDFLNLNVFTPDLGDARLPVLVWIHGGGFVSGCNRSPWYRGTRFARDGVVVVNVGYRLGVEGFLEIDDAPSNRAVLDWLVALEWVQQNIASFGGDPSKVTIAGQSAGSAACLALLANPRARGLFRGVIGMSGTSDTRMPREAAAELAAKMAAHLGVRPTRADLASFEPDALIEAFGAVGRNPFSAESVSSGFDPRAPALKPYVDGDVIPEHPFRAIASGTGRDVPLLAGSTSQEINAGVLMRRKDLEGQVAVNALTAMGISGHVLDGYRKQVGTDDPVDLLAQAITDRAFRVPLARLLEDRAALGPTWAYQFQWRTPLRPRSTAMHCIDIPFTFDNLDAEGVDEGAPQSLADEMHSAWVRFVELGDPGWPSYEQNRRAVMEFDVPSQLADDPLHVGRELF
jgi:para-nitrobenzyl esterase